MVRPPVRLVLAGVDPSGPLAAMVRDVPAPHSVVCLPFTSEIAPLYHLLELALLPSRMEGFSQSLLEAMALGKPVIASAAGGNAELVADGINGLLVAPMDPAAWAGAIERLLGDPRLAGGVGEAARHTARERFSLDRTVNRTLELYRSLVPHAALAPAAPHW
jgi:glycosyltransferase involved in cell wall biosynthesis